MLIILVEKDCYVINKNKNCFFIIVLHISDLTQTSDVDLEKLHFSRTSSATGLSLMANVMIVYVNHSLLLIKDINIALSLSLSLSLGLSLSLSLSLSVCVCVCVSQL